MLAFSGTLPITRLTVGSLDPITTGLGREVVAAVLAAIALKIGHASRPTRAQWNGLGLVALGVAVGWPLLITIALQQVPASHGIVVTGLLPMATALFALIRGYERPSAAFWVASVIAVAAIVSFAVFQGGGSFRLPDVLLLGAVVLCGLGYAEGAVLARTLGSWPVICWALLLSAPVLIPVVAWQVCTHPPHATLTAWLALSYLAAISAFAGFFAWYRGLALGGTAKIGQLQLVSPVLSLLWVYLFLNEQLTTPTVLAMTAVLACALVVQRTKVH